MLIKTGACKLIHYFHLDPKYSLLTGKMVKVLYEFFRLMDIHDVNALNDIQFFHLVRHITNLNDKQIYDVFDMLDTDGSGKIDFDEFYLLFCIFVAHKVHELYFNFLVDCAVQDGVIKQFIFRHSRTVFDLLDVDGSNGISAVEFGMCSYLFNFHGPAIRHIFFEFDVSGDDLLDYREFRMFCMACIDKQSELDKERRERGVVGRLPIISRIRSAISMTDAAAAAGQDRPPTHSPTNEAHASGQKNSSDKRP